MGPSMVYIAVAEVAGFAFLARRLRLASIPVAILYFPLMYALLLRFALVVACGFGNCL